jgi:hypothetical protein
VVVQGGVQVAVADDGMRAGAGEVLVVRPALPADGPVAAAVGDVAEFLDVDVHQLAGPVPLIAADRHGGGPVQARQPRAAVTDQHLVHGGGV